MTPEDLLKPAGFPIGVEGSRPGIREVSGDSDEAEAFFNSLAAGGTDITPPTYPGRMVQLPGGGVIGFRPNSASGPPTIDVNLPSLPDIDKIKFV